MLFTNLMLWGLNLIEGAMDWIFQPFEWMTLHVNFLQSVANVFGYMDSFVHLDILFSWVVTILIFDNLEIIMRFFVGLYEKIPLT